MYRKIYDISKHFNELKVYHTFAILDEDSKRATELKKTIDKVHVLVDTVTHENARHVLNELIKGTKMKDIADSMRMSLQWVYWCRSKYLKDVEQQIKAVIDEGIRV